jgi:hypothetical protein
MYLPKTEFGQQITQTKINNNNIDLPKSCFIQCTQIMITSIPCNPKQYHPLLMHAHIHTHTPEIMAVLMSSNASSATMRCGCKNSILSLVYQFVS